MATLSCMETKSAVLGAAGMLFAGGLAFGLIGIANADSQPAPAPSTAATTTAPEPTPEPVVTETPVEPAPEPVIEEPAAVEPAPEPAYVEPAPVYVAAPAPVYVEPAPIPAQNGVVNAPADPGDIKNTGRGAQPTDGSTAIIQR